MSSFATQFDPVVGPVLPVTVIKINSDGSPANLSDRQEDMHIFNGLLDTGASVTCISATVVSNVDLNPTGKVEMLGSTGKRLVNEYFFGIGFMIAQAQQPTGQISSQWELIPIRGSFFEGSGSGFDVLIGRDILCQGVFTMSFDGHIALSR